MFGSTQLNQIEQSIIITLMTCEEQSMCKDGIQHMVRSLQFIKLSRDEIRGVICLVQGLEA